MTRVAPGLYGTRSVPPDLLAIALFVRIDLVSLPLTP
jgi:hypothetical protein